MKLVQFIKNDHPYLGILTPKGIVDVDAEAERQGLFAPVRMLDAISMGRPARSMLERLANNAKNFVTAPLAPVVTGTDRIFCIGLNYRQHAQECNMEFPPAPVLFNKYGNALAAHEQCIRLMPQYKEYDYEAELVIVMGKNARNIREQDALAYVFGYTCGNDLSTRDLQFSRGNQWFLSKTLDGFAPIGPCIVTADSLNPDRLMISSRVNGEIRQKSNTSDMIFSPAKIIADLSKHITLQPGDLIFTGTPSGVMHGYPADKKNWLKPGDTVEVTIDGIGTLKNTFC